MSEKTKYIIYYIFDMLLTYGGTAGVIIYNYVSPDNSWGFKLSFSGIVLLICLVLFSKSLFEKKYQNTMNSYLQQLAQATDDAVKAEISKKIDQHKTTNYIYQRLMALLPFLILYIVSWLGATSLNSLRGTVGLILMSLGFGSIFNILKKNTFEKYKLEQIKNKINKKG